MTPAEQAAREQIGYWIKCAAFHQPLMGVDWTRRENQRWLDVADQIIAYLSPAAALEQARREEREACAQHIEREMYQLDTGEVAAMGPLEHYNVVLREMADSIRARAQEEQS